MSDFRLYPFPLSPFLLLILLPIVVPYQLILARRIAAPARHGVPRGWWYGSLLLRSITEHYLPYPPPLATYRISQLALVQSRRARCGRYGGRMVVPVEYGNLSGYGRSIDFSDLLYHRIEYNCFPSLSEP